MVGERNASAEISKKPKLLQKKPKILSQFGAQIPMTRFTLEKESKAIGKKLVEGANRFQLIKKTMFGV